MLKKLIVIIGIILFAFGFTEAAEKKDVKEKQTTAQSEKCWKRVKPFEGTGNAPVCVAFEKLLNTTCESPKKLKCDWSLPRGEKRFKKLKWQPLDLKGYRSLTEDYVLGEAYSKKHDPEYKKMRWQTINPDFKKAFEEDKLKIKMAVVDIDHDGHVEQVVGYSLQSDCERSSFVIMNTKTKRVDWRYEHLFLSLNASEGTEIMLYDRRAFMFGLDELRTMVMIYEGSNGSNERGRQNVCQISYIKGGK